MTSLGAYGVLRPGVRHEAGSRCVALGSEASTVGQLRAQVATLRRDFDDVLERERESGRQQLDRMVQAFEARVAFLDRAIDSGEREHQQRLARVRGRLQGLEKAVAAENALLAEALRDEKGGEHG